MPLSSQAKFKRSSLAKGVFLPIGFEIEPPIPILLSHFLSLFTVP